MDLQRKIESRQARVGVLGLGYVGLPLAVEFARRAFPVTGFETSAQRASAVAKGRSYVPDVRSELLERLVKGGRLKAVSRFDELAAQDALILCVPTPMRKTRDPDVSYIVAAADEVAKRLRKGQLVVLESTTYPGTTKEVVLPRLQKRGLKEGRDFFLAFSPERVDPGNRVFGIANTPKVVGGVSKASGRLAKLLYSQVVQQVVEVSDASTAEMVKLLENTFRAVNIGLINEVASMCDRLGLDVWEVVDAAKTKPFGFMPFYPGPGLGGECIPLDPQKLSWKMRSLNFEPRFVDLAGVVNASMPRRVVERVARLLNGKSRSLRGSRILAIGVAYKPDVGDVRESPAADVLQLLIEAGSKVSYHDPLVARLDLPGGRLRSIRLTSAALRSADCVVILTAHGAVDYRSIVKKAKLVFDTRNATRGLTAPNLARL